MFFFLGGFRTLERHDGPKKNAAGNAEQQCRQRKIKDQNGL
jgi:hypothetical protein